ncbi:hypothetical protein ACFE04_028742 [Oxalis oulophora]
MEEDEDCSQWRCKYCDNVGLTLAEDGYYYCNLCAAQSQDFIDTGVADEEFGGPGAIYTASLRRSCRPSQSQQPTTTFIKSESQQFFSQFTNQTPLDDGVGPTQPEDFGGTANANGNEEIGGGELGYEEYYNEIRMRYVMGLQLMLQSQCESLVRNFNVHPSICGIVAPIWLRFVASTGVLRDAWADDSIQESELLIVEDPKDSMPRGKYRAEPHNIHGQRAVTIWVRALRKKIPLSSTLAVSFLACHVAREAVLPTDIIKWSIEGTLPYLSAYLEIQEQFGKPSKACPISASVMFRPSLTPPLQILESLAASIAHTIGLYLPPVNFYAIASRYLKQLSLPVEKILPHACRIQEWAMPPELWLSRSDLRLPTRVCVMSILLVTIRILYDINGFGVWEKSFSDPSVASRHEESLGQENLDRSPDFMNDDDDDDEDTEYPTRSVDDLGGNFSGKLPHDIKHGLDATEILRSLEAKYSEIRDRSAYREDLTSYLQYCKDVPFAGLKPPFGDYEEERSMELFWNFFEREQKDFESLEDLEEQTGSPSNYKTQKTNNDSPSKQNNKSGNGMDDVSPSQESKPLEPHKDNHKDKAIARLKLDMAENRFSYIPPRVKIKRRDFLHYARKRDEGSLSYVAHADYYILLRACARVAQVDIRTMHSGSLSFERRLAWTEKRIDHCLHVIPPAMTCEFCSENNGDDPSLS